MALADLVTLELKQGDRVRWKVTITEDDGETPVDLTGYEWEFAIARSRGREPAWVFSESPNIVTSSATVDPTEGEIEFGLLPADSRAFGSAESLEFELTGNPASDATERTTFVGGSLTVRREVANVVES